MLTLALELEGFEVGQAANGLRLISAMHVDRPDVILLDVMMSWIDGFELCRAIKRNPTFADIPVIFISARKSAGGRADRAGGRGGGLLLQAHRHGRADRADPRDPGRARGQPEPVGPHWAGPAPLTRRRAAPRRAPARGRPWPRPAAARRPAARRWPSAGSSQRMQRSCSGA